MKKAIFNGLIFGGLLFFIYVWNAAESEEMFVGMIAAAGLLVVKIFIGLLLDAVMTAGVEYKWRKMHKRKRKVTRSVTK